ncbi:hypothetical protein [Novosphingobium sp. SG707]|uniref:hypothetical protein n=1 Tax=Novosphingobium sp. SG707 TaxID=2586996 RepID=UPI001446E14C|nr:hypothetical protein [Novosphingobium sp. SG707]NKI99574.1 hypothetical protein [Novosphingobium sp. SG707]
MKYVIPIASLTAHVNPLDGKMWNVSPINSSEVNQAVVDNNVDDRPWQEVKEYLERLPTNDQREYHIKRIAWLVTNHCGNSAHPMGIAELPSGIGFVDGNHRAAAAIVRGDSEIELVVAILGDVTAVFPGAQVA